MFVLNEQEKGFSPSQEKDVVSVLHSINEPKVAAAERPAEPTRAFICTFQLMPDEVNIRVILYLTRSRVSLVYVSEEGPCPVARRKETEAEALDFVESMGFMMDNMNLAKLSPADRKTALKELPIFEVPAEEMVLDRIKEAEAQLAASRKFRAEEEMPIVSRSRPKPAPSEAESSDSLSLEDLEAEFRRDEVGLGDVDSALDSVFGAPPRGGGEPEGLGAMRREAGVSSKWKTIVRFLASF